MSALLWPRMYIAGYTFWSPSTFNNNDYLPQIDPYDQENATINWAYVRGQGVDSVESFKRWAVRPLPSDSPADRVPPSEWGYYGGNECGFVTADAPHIESARFRKPAEHTRITGYTGRGGYVGAGDPWIGLPIQLNLNMRSAAKLVDVNPTSFWSSQIFFDSLTLGDEQAGLSARPASRMHSRWQYLGRNYNADGELMIAGALSALFQTTFAKETLEVRAAGSGLAAELSAALDQPEIAGLMLRFVSYETIYFQGDVFSGPAGDSFARMEQIAALYQQYVADLEAYQQGRLAEKPIRPINRAYSRIVGWLAPWRAGEWKSAPDGRLLLPVIQPGQQPGLPQPAAVRPSNLPDSFYAKDPQSGQMPATTTLGPATVEVASDGAQVTRLAVDLCTAIPERDSGGVKAAFGRIQLALALPGGGFDPIADLVDDSDGAAYRAEYQRTAGVVDVPAESFLRPVSAAEIADTPLALLVESYTPDGKGGLSAQRVAGLVENPLYAQTDERGVYVDEPGAHWRPDPQVSFEVRVRHFGRAPGPGTLLAVAQYASDPVGGVWRMVAEGGGEGIPPYVRLRHGARAFTRGYIAPLAGDRLSLRAEALRPGQPNIGFFPIAPTPGGRRRRGVRAETFGFPNPLPFPLVASTGYAVVRALPFHNSHAAYFDGWLATGPDVELVNQWVFDTVFRVYHMMYPVMDFINDPARFQAWRGIVSRVTDPALFESASYMPVTRALSAAQRYIVQRYQEYLDEIAPKQLARERPAVAPRPRRG